VPVSPGTYTYKFRNGYYNYWDGPGWESADLLQECGYGEWNDRQFTLNTEDLVLGPYCFSSCEPCINDTVCENSGDVNDDGAVNVLDILMIVSEIIGEMVFSDNQLCAADMNEDAALNVLDILIIVEQILGNRGVSATNVEIIKTIHAVHMNADGVVGAVQMTLNHGEDFELTLTSKALVADYNTKGNSTTLIVVSPEGNELFTSYGEFTIESVIAASADSYLNTEVSVPADFFISNAYPNPFNPTTTLSVELNTETYVSMKVFNVMGQLIEVIAEGSMNGGAHVITWDASQLPSGIYLIHTEAGNTIHQQKVMLLK